MMRSLASRARASAAVLTGCAAMLLAGAASANGRYPAAGLIALDPSDPKHIVVRTTYGVLSTSDAGGSWTWLCEQSVGFSDNEDPMVAITKDGTVLAGVFKGLSVSKDRGCDWAFVGGDLTDRYVVDLSTEKSAPENAIAIASNGIGGGKFKTQLFETKDNGATWAQLGPDLPEEFLGLSIDIAPSDGQRLYATGRFGAPEYTGILQRSDDRGQTWTSYAIPGADDKHPPYLSAVDPNDANIVYVRLDAAEADVLVMSKDGGETWDVVFQETGALLGFALSPDGSKIAVGGDKDGLWTAPVSTLAFTKVADLRVKCLLWTPDVLYACADEFKDGFHIGVSDNEGKTFTAFEHLQDVCPMECPDGTTTQLECPKQWGAVSLTINATCGDGGSGGAGAGGTGGTGGSSPTSGGGDGCNCNLTGGTTAGGAVLFGMAALLSMARRRRRKAR
ncbi:MAG: MYXO-CTERM sorting domain-containing protein [Polyangiaceae bacterium]